MPIEKQDKHALDPMRGDWSERYGDCQQDHLACLDLQNKFRGDVPELAPRLTRSAVASRHDIPVVRQNCYDRADENSVLAVEMSHGE